MKSIKFYQQSVVTLFKKEEKNFLVLRINLISSSRLSNGRGYTWSWIGGGGGLRKKTQMHFEGAIFSFFQVISCICKRGKIFDFRGQISIWRRKGFLNEGEYHHTTGYTLHGHVLKSVSQLSLDRLYLCQFQNTIS